MPVIDGGFCPTACQVSCETAAMHRDADGTWTTTLAIAVFCVLAVDALLAGVAIFLAGTAPADAAKESRTLCANAAGARPSM